MKKILGSIFSLLLALFLGTQGLELYLETTPAPPVHLEQVPAYSGTPYVHLAGNVPSFGPEDLSTQGMERYSPLDVLGRCGPAFAVVGRETMPTEERGAIGQVKPSGWHLAKYDCVDGKYLYNRCHLIGFQLTGENANVQNLITGTRYMNVDGMLPFENEVADYVTKTGNHVAYRVTPVFQGNELVARGVQMEARSVEDKGLGVCFNVYVYNAQPGVVIDYATGESWLAQEQGEEEENRVPELTFPDITLPEIELPAIVLPDFPGWEKEPAGEEGPGTDVPEGSYILNQSSGRFHRPNCSGVTSMKESNKQVTTQSRDNLLAQGYIPCGQCGA